MARRRSCAHNYCNRIELNGMQLFPNEFQCHVRSSTAEPPLAKDIMVRFCADASPTLCLEHHQLGERVPVYWHDQPGQATMESYLFAVLDLYTVLTRELYLVAPAKRNDVLRSGQQLTSLMVMSIKCCLGEKVWGSSGIRLKGFPTLQFPRHCKRCFNYTQTTENKTVAQPVYIFTMRTSCTS